MVQKKKNKTLLYLGVAGAALIIFVIIGKSTGIIGGDDLTKVTIEKVQLRNLVQTVSANGKVQPEVEVKISSDVSGEIILLNVKEGDSVVMGQLLAVIDPEIYQSLLERSEAALNNAKANLANSRSRLYQVEVRMKEAESQFSRNKKMYDQKLIADAEMEAAQTAYATAKADYESTKQNIIAAEFTVKTQEAGLKEAAKNLSRTKIYAPVSGIVSKLSVEKGERVVGTSQMTGTEMMRIANLNDMEVSVDVNENDVIRVSLGDSVNIEVDAYNNRIFKGMVTEVANSATTTTQSTSDQVTNFVVKIRILRSSYEDLLEIYGTRKAVFRPGMSASVEIQTEYANNVLTIPIESVTMKDMSEFDSTKTKDLKGLEVKKQTEAVFVHRDGVVHLTKVKTGIQDEKYIQILDGLQDNEEVVTGPYSAISRTLKKGAKVSITTKDKLFTDTKK
jgi:HlyD family secretion protein